MDIIDITYTPKISLTYKSPFKHIKIVRVYLQVAKIFVDYNNARMPFYIYMRYLYQLLIRNNFMLVQGNHSFNTFRNK